MMDEMCYIVATKHGGSLKGEHGTGRNIAPYVEMEWGTTAYELMWELKELFDPEYILNPGVILNKVRRGSWLRALRFEARCCPRCAPWHVRRGWSQGARGVYQAGRARA